MCEIISRFQFNSNTAYKHFMEKNHKNVTVIFIIKETEREIRNPNVWFHPYEFHPGTLGGLRWGLRTDRE